MNINKVAPKLPKDQKLDESYYNEINAIWQEVKHLQASGIQVHPTLLKYENLENYMGVAQGSPTSPLLSILCLRKFLTQAKSVSYADDPLFYGDEDFQIEDFKHLGLEIAQEKSG